MYILTPWLMKPGGSMPHSHGLSNNPYSESNKPNFSYYIFIQTENNSSLLWVLSFTG